MALIIVLPQAFIVVKQNSVIYRKAAPVAYLLSANVFMLFIIHRLATFGAYLVVIGSVALPAAGFMAHIDFRNQRIGFAAAVAGRGCAGSFKVSGDGCVINAAHIAMDGSVMRKRIFGSLIS